MPIASIILQPSSNAIKAAYRPVVIRASATRTDADPRPPVVYCDIYFNDVFYKTIAKSKYIQLNPTNSEWQFDVQDAAQEYLSKFLADNGESSVVEATPLITKALCKLRSSGYDSDGFIVPEGTIPVQGTGDVPAEAGTGTETNTFYIINATLQHEENQDLADHLDTFKNGTWAADAWPLSHRPNHYRICPQDSDSFPILKSGEVALISLVLHYRPCSETDFISVESNLPCEAVAIVGTPALPDAVEDTAYSYSFEFTGTTPAYLINVQKPDWMTIEIVGNEVIFSGMPTTGDIGTNIPVGFDIVNCAGTYQGSGSPSGSGSGSGYDEISFDNLIDVTAASSCTPVTISGGDPVFPDITLGDTYDFDITLLGTAPFSLSDVVKPSWMTIELTGSTIHIGGTPDGTNVGTAIPVSFTVSNCSGANEVDVSDTIDVLLVSYECGEVITQETVSAGYVDLGLFHLDVDAADTVDLNWQSMDRPNRFSLYNNGVLVETTGWRGTAAYGGPWGASLSTATSGTITFDVSGGPYTLRVEVGNADPDNITSDNFQVTIGCTAS
jgi:hypothetical protein